MAPQAASATPVAPVTTAATAVTQTGFTANWGASSGATGYLLDLSLDSNFTSYVSGFNSLDVGNVTSYIVNGLNPAVTYYYRVRAYDAVDTSLNSNISALLTLPATPGVPVATTATLVTQTGFNANWSASAGASGYRLDVATDAAFASLVSGYSDKDVGNSISSPVSGLTAGTTYYYRIRAYNSGGTSVSSNTSVLVTLPDIPAAPVASGPTAVTQTSATLTWNASSGATGYRLDVSVKPDLSTFVSGYNNLDVANVTSTGISGLTANTTYYYRVRAYNAGGTSGNSATGVLVTLPLPPAAPLATAATAITLVSFNANWNAVAGVGGYQLDIASDTGFTSFITGYNNKDVGNVTTVAVSGLTAGTKYYYRVRAYNNGGAGASSGTVSLTTVPDAPVAVAASTVTQTGFSANWGAVNGATGYRLDVSLDAGFATFVTGYNSKDVANVISSAVSSLKGGTTYYYRVRAYTTGGASGNSNSIALTTMATPLATAASSVSQSGFTANWNPAAGAGGYLLDVATNATFTTFVTGYSNRDVANVTSSIITGLTAGSTYYYRVRAYNSTATSTNSNTISQITLATPVAAAATAITQAGFTANWGTVSGATGYRLDVATDAGFTAFVTGYSDLDVTNVTTFAVGGLTSGVSYYYRVRSYNTTVTSISSNTVALTTVPVAPVAAAATGITQTGLTANWGSVSGATGYMLDVSASSAFGTFVSGYSSKDVGNVTSFAVSGLAAGTTYYYRVRAYNTPLNPSPNSNSISLTTLATPLATPAAGITQTGFTATWNVAASAAGYLLDVATTSGFTTFVSGYNNLDVANATSFAISGLIANTTYYYRVRAYNGTATSVSSNAVSLKTLATPVASAATSITQTSFKANWGAASSATGYLLDVAVDPAFSSIVTGYNSQDVGNVTGFIATGLTAGSTYYYRVRSYTSAGVSSNSNTITVPMLPPTPATPIAIAATATTQTGFTANWGAVSGATGYYLDVATDAAFNNILTAYKNKNVATVTSSAVSGLTAGTWYYYRVRAYNTGGTSGSSNVINPLTLPTVPVATAATLVTQTGLAANWNTVAGAGGYRLDVATTSAFTTLVAGYNDLDTANVTSYSVSGLNAGSTYYYRVRSYNAGGASVSSNVITQITIPPEPVAITATAVTQTGFKATWVAAAGATGYRLDVASDPGFTTLLGAYNDLNVLNVTSYAVSGLSQDSVYYYRVRAFNTAGTSGNSNSISQATLATPVATAATSITQTTFTANWGAAGGAASYKLDVSTSPSFATFVSGYNNKDVGNVTSSVVSGLAAGTTYYYRVRAFSVSVSSGNSNVIIQATLGTPLATAATSVTQTGFTATWGAATAATGYQLDVASDSGFTTFVTGYNNRDVAAAASLAINGLTPGTPYYYRVRAYNTGSTSTNSATITLATLPATPAIPVAKAATLVTQYGFTANWSTVSGATGYLLDLSVDPGFASFVSGYNNLDVHNVASYAISGLAAGIPHYYRVRAYNTGGTSASSGVISQTTLPPTSPSVPVAAAASAPATTGFTSNWSAVVGADGYILDVADNAAFSSMLTGYAAKNVGNVTGFTISGLAPGSTYYYRLRAYNAAGTSAVSNTITAVTLPDAPLAAAANAITTSGFAAAWGTVSGATGYRLDVALDAAFTTFVAGYNGKDVSTATSSIVTGLTAGTSYYYRVRAYNSAGAGANSNTVSQTTLPAAPLAKAATFVSQTGFSANWDAVSGATGYQLDVATDTAFTNLVTGYANKDVGNITASAVSALANGTTYYIRVRAYNTGGASANSNTIIQATLPATPAAPVAAPATSVIPSGFTANWGPVYGVTGYKIDVSSTADFSSFVVGYNNYDVGNNTSVPVVGLTPGLAYFYRVRAYNDGGSSIDSNVITTATASALLTVTITGSGGGSVHSDTGGIACINGSSNNCSASYDGGIQVTLTATADASSILSGWTGAPCSGSNVCVVALDSAQNVSAAFDITPPVRIFNAVTPLPFDSLQAAYNAANDGDLVQLREGALIGDLTADRPISISIVGGYDAAYTQVSLDTQLQGILTLKQGTVRIQNVKLK